MKKDFFKSIFFYNIWFIFLFAYLEIIFHVSFFNNLNVLLPLLFSLPIAILFSVITHLFSRKINRIVGFILTLFVCIFFDAEIIYHAVFQTFFAPISLLPMIKNVFIFREMAISQASTKIILLLIVNLPLILYWFVTWHKNFLQKKTLRKNLYGILVAIVCHCVAIGSLFLYTTTYYSPYNLYYENFIIDKAVQSLGVTTSIRLDGANVLGEKIPILKRRTIIPSIVNCISTLQESNNPNEELATEPSHSDLPSLESSEHNSDSNISDTQATNPEESTSAEEEPIVYSSETHHIMYDFEALAKEATNPVIKYLHTYMSTQVPDEKNSYTGMFEGYNVIWILGESLWTYAIRPDITPTLYKMATEGFVFENYYTPLWYGSTSGGEFAFLTGLIPMESGGFFLDITGQNSNDMRTTLSMKLSSLGYTTGAYHNFLYDQYNRHLSHPNMGFTTWWAYKTGFIPEPSPGMPGTCRYNQSDLKLVQDSVDLFIEDSPFFTYYIGYSGHAPWSSSNPICMQNLDAVEDLDYSNTVKYYLSANVEFEKALVYLIEKLEEKGILENTLFIITPDHFPYADKEMCDELAGHTLDEKMEWAENSLIIWSASMKEPITVEKRCSSIDVLPTVCNLMGVEYDSRLLMGRDILGNSTELVMFPGHHWINDKCKYFQYEYYYSATPLLKGDKLSDDYIAQICNTVRQKFEISTEIVKLDYYSYLP